MKIFDWNSEGDRSQRRNGQLQLMLHLVMCVPVEPYVIVCFVVRDGAETRKQAPGVSAHTDKETY